MAFKEKVALVILIIIFKLHDLNTATLSDRYKTAISDITNSNNSNNSSRSSGSGSNHNNINNNGSFNVVHEYYNNNNNNSEIKEIIDNAAQSADIRPITPATNTTNDRQINNKYLLPLANSSSNEDFVVFDAADNAKLPTQTKAFYDNDRNDSSPDSYGSGSNFLSKNFSKNVDNGDFVNNQHYNVAMQFRTVDQQQSNLTTEFFNSSEPPTNTAENAGEYYQYNLIENNNKEKEVGHVHTNNNLEGPGMGEGPLHPFEGPPAEIGMGPKNIFNDWMENPLEVEKFVREYRTELDNQCAMDVMKSAILWWAFGNGTLNFETVNDKSSNHIDISYRNLTDDEKLFNTTLERQTRIGRDVVFFSAAYNNLSQIPYRTLATMNRTLRFLMLKGNSFSSFKEDDQNDEESIDWATFPRISYLTELDISYCNIEYIALNVFENITGLIKLFMSHNRIHTIPDGAFQLLPNLEYIDLSFTNLLQPDYELPRLNTVRKSGLYLSVGTFKNLNKLIYLDLSHTKLTHSSAIAFRQLSQSVKYMSLCYTSLPMVSNALFNNTNLIGLDLSGNHFGPLNIIEDYFVPIADTLKYLFFENSDLKQLDWLKHLKNLKILDLASNNINSLSSDYFSSLKYLQALDLSWNNIGNWYEQVFANNTELRMLELNNNNINIINYEMLKDFMSLDYLSLGKNDFICDCLLPDLVEVAAMNSKKAMCLRVLQKDEPNLNEADLKFTFTSFDDLIPSLLTQHYIKNLEWNSMLRSIVNQTDACPLANLTYSQMNKSIPKFQLVDYDDDQYWCFNRTIRMQFDQLDCPLTSFDQIITENISKLTQILLASIFSIVGVTLLIVFLYLKRWHVYYYYSSLKSAALLAMATKDQVNKFNALTESDPSMIYDIFISYCQSDRNWVLEELIPNVEEAGNISICLHERDFQIGVAILENIISCMDRSRALMLIISSNFLLSHWCQFEMHLAQHRIFELSKEHLIIVFLEDIPRNKRPKALQYLMEVKTYIKWPGVKGSAIKPEERKYFWKRLQRSLDHIGSSATYSDA
ncbi:toll-like receptor 3 [Anastrepha obliqua]|uniref:toll-like receptor 3 n=1 Tax=Anastrepha obliqua TaxID=95512 RepID=UPI00240A4BEA|nr:toll-like receptor 3 [Anastrepha obliqua]